MKKYLVYSFLFAVFNLLTHAVNRSNSHYSPYSLERRELQEENSPNSYHSVGITPRQATLTRLSEEEIEAKRRILAEKLNHVKEKVFRNDFSPKVCNSKCTRNTCDDMVVMALCLAACEWRTIQNCATKTPAQFMLGAAKLVGFETRNLEFSDSLCTQNNSVNPLPYQGEEAIEWWERNVLKEHARYQGQTNCRMVWDVLEKHPIKRN